jgi:hypothetical protein
MPITMHLYRTLSRTYRDGRLNPVEYVTTAKALAPTRVEEGNGYDIGETLHFRVITAPADRGVDLTGVIEDTLSGGGCSHERDCCGCASRYATAQRVGAREYKVKYSVSYNY